MRSCCWNEHCPSLCLFFSFFPFPLIPQCCTVSFLPQPWPQSGQCCKAEESHEIPCKCNEPWNVRELWGIRMCCYTEQLSAPGTSARECTQSCTHGPCSLAEKHGRFGLHFISFPSFHSSLMYLMLLNFNFLEMTQTGRGS